MELRQAHYSDADLLFGWRLEDEKTAGWWRGEHPSMVEHRHWLEGRLQAHEVCRIYIAEIEMVPVGQARVESSGEISFSIAPGSRRQGLGRELVERASEAAIQDLGLPRLKALVDGSNKAGLATLLAAGYELHPDVSYLTFSP